MEVRVEPEVLDAASRACDGLRGGLRVSARDVEPETEAAISGLAGWDTRAALDRLLWSWRHDLGGLAGYLEKFSDALAGCASDYRHTDRANAASFDIRGR